jgi:hypothetical protein
MQLKSSNILVLLIAIFPLFQIAAMDKAGPDHSIWSDLLKKHVSETGKVDYAGFVKDQEQLDAYLAELAQFPVQPDWPRNHQMAYWINAYNAFTVKLIVDHYPVQSIRDLHEGNPWEVKWIKLGGQTYSLDNIENDILRPQYKDARIHFAVNCAARSCPPLLNKAFTANQLDQLLDQQASKFINNKRYNQITPESVKVSMIFEWYEEDFGQLIQYLNQFSKTDIPRNAKIEFATYDWALNN